MKKIRVGFKNFPNSIAKSRRLFYLSHPNHSDSLVSAIESAGWQVSVSTDWTKVGELHEEHDFSVGLMHLEPDRDFATCKRINLLQYWEDLYRTNDSTQWLALLPRDALQDDRLCELLKSYFFDFHTLPVDLPRLLSALGHAHGMAELKRRSSQWQLSGKVEGCGIIGQSLVVQKLRRDIEKISQVDAPALIIGESGTGKELTAYSIHQRSRRRAAPFIAVNCAAIPASLIQSELFGYEKGAFTGAQQRKIGRIEAAMGGTIFFDEIGDLSLELQGNLLRFLQEKTIERLGGLDSIHVDVRILAATHVDLEKMVTAGRFRNDLYYRLNVLRLRTPSLCERGQDIELMAKYFFDHFAKERNPCVKGFSQQALHVMSRYHWPGNVRELINRIRQAMVMSEHKLITPDDLGLEEWEQSHNVVTLNMARNVAEKEAILTALRYTNNNVTQAAHMLGISRITLHRFLQKYNIQAHEPLADPDLGLANSVA